MEAQGTRPCTKTGVGEMDQHEMVAIVERLLKAEGAGDVEGAG
jgi:hypothetical protein